jgi:hypothetical protein
MVNLTLNMPVDPKLPAVIKAFFDTRCKEAQLQLQFLRQLSVTCHFRWAQGWRACVCLGG